MRSLFIRTHRWMRLHEWVQLYMIQTGFSYVSCLDHSLIHALIKRWRHQTYMFYLKYGEMTPTLQDVTVLLGLPIDRQVVTFTGVCNRIALYKRSFRLLPPPFELTEGVEYVLCGLMRYFRHHQMMVMMRSCGGIKLIMI